MSLPGSLLHAAKFSATPHIVHSRENKTPSRLHFLLMALGPLIRTSFIRPCTLFPQSLRNASTSHRQAKQRHAYNKRVKMSLPSVETLRGASFMSCVEHSRTILSGSTSVDSTQLELISALLSTSNGARGLLVTLLSDEAVGMADVEPVAEELVGVIAEGGEETRGLMAKNVVMSSCMVVEYGRRGQVEMGKGSLLTRERAVRVAKAVRKVDQGLDRVLREMTSELEGGEGRFKGFAEKWRYDEEQKREGVKWLNEVLKEG